ncbi:hypothetical protein PWW31_15575 [Vibrio harveyi]|nr:hypothetical protein PWW31_15575 [Vibrio harveyi]
MHFKDVLSDVEKLVGKRLQPLNPKTQPIYITKIDTDSKKYFVSSNPDELGSARFFWELEAIWSDLTQKGFCNVDQSLFGSGSSRNQPETIFANLPYIQYFRFKGKKHIFFRRAPIHEFGTLSELVGDELSTILSKIDNYFALSNQDISFRQSKVLNSLEAVQSRIQSGSSSASIGRDLELAVKALASLEHDVSESIVALISEQQRNNSQPVKETKKLEVKPS